MKPFTAKAYADLVGALLDGPCTYTELRAASGLGHTATFCFLDALRAPPQRVRVCGWEKDGRNRSSVRVFEFSELPDVIKPTATTSTQRMVSKRERAARDTAAAVHAAFFTSKETA